MARAGIGYFGRMKKEYAVTKKKIPSTGRNIEVLILHPTVHAKPGKYTPGILWLHGGGYITGMAGMIYMSRALNLVRKYGAVVIAPEYRLAGEEPYPAALMMVFWIISSVFWGLMQNWMNYSWTVQLFRPISIVPVQKRGAFQ